MCIQEIRSIQQSGWILLIRSYSLRIFTIFGLKDDFYTSSDFDDESIVVSILVGFTFGVIFS